jgi:hypothetical protein
MKTNGAALTAMTILGSGAITIPGTLTSGSFVKSGGTSSQFLKADGSVDSNTYVTGGPYLPLSGGVMTGSINMATTGTSYVRMGNFPNVTTNTGEAWIGRASDRNTGTMTVQLGGNSSSSRFFEVVDYAWTTVLFSVNSNGSITANSNIYMTNTNYAFGTSYWAGAFGYPGYQYTGGNSRFGFSSTGGYIDVYTDGNFYAGIDLNGSNNLVLHTGNYTSYAPSLTGGGASGTWGISISGNAATAYGWSNTPDSWYGIGQTTSASGATAVGGYYPWALSYHTGLAFSAHSAYGGIRFYNQNYPTGPLASTPVLQLVNYQAYINGNVAIHAGNYTSYVDAPNKAGTSYYQATTWINFNGTAAGLYWSGISTDIGYVEFYANGGNYSYGAAILEGRRNAYSGINLVHGGGVVVGMYDSAGNGGAWDSTNGWHFYYLRSNACMGINTSTTSSSYGCYVNKGIYSTGDIVAYSDVRKKENIITVENAIDIVTNLRGVFYNRIDDVNKKRTIGVIAQETEQVLPEVVTYASDIDEYGVSYGNFSGLFIEAFKEQQKRIDSQDKIIEELKTIIDGLTK